MPLLTLHLFKDARRQGSNPFTSPKTIFIEDDETASKTLAAVIREQVTRSDNSLFYSDNDIIAAETWGGNDVIQIIHRPIAIFFESIKFDQQKELYVTIPSRPRPPDWVQHQFQLQPPLPPQPYSHPYAYPHHQPPIPPHSSSYHVASAPSVSPDYNYSQWEDNHHEQNYRSNSIPRLPPPPSLPMNYHPWQSQRGLERPPLNEFYPLNNNVPMKRQSRPPPNHHHHDHQATKRMKKQPTTTQNDNNKSNNNASSNNEDRTKSCSKCNKLLPWALFSKRQWTMREEARQCRICVEEEMAARRKVKEGSMSDNQKVEEKAEEHQSVALARPDDIDAGKSSGNNNNNVNSNTTSDNNKSSAGQSTKEVVTSKMCNICRESLPASSFSKRQWKAHADLRLCATCVKVRNAEKEGKSVDADMAVVKTTCGAEVVKSAEDHDIENLDDKNWVLQSNAAIPETGPKNEIMGETSMADEIKSGFVKTRNAGKEWKSLDANTIVVKSSTGPKAVESAQDHAIWKHDEGNSQIQSNATIPIVEPKNKTKEETAREIGDEIERASPPSSRSCRDQLHSCQ